MKSILLSGAAALALVFGTSAVMAQSAAGPSGGSDILNNAPPSGGASGGAGAAPSAGPGGYGVDPKSGASATGQRDEMRDKVGTNSQGEKIQDQKSGASAQGEKIQDKKTDTRAQGDADKTDRSAAGATDAKDGKMNEGRAAASAEINAEQKTTIREHIRTEKVDRVNIDVDLNIGAALPSSVHTHVHPVPVWLVEIVPAYRGYSYIVLADGRIVIIEPQSYEVVTIITV